MSDNNDDSGFYEKFIRGGELVDSVHPLDAGGVFQEREIKVNKKPLMLEDKAAPKKRGPKAKVPPLPPINLKESEYERQLAIHNVPKRKVKVVEAEVVVEEDEVELEEIEVEKKTVVFTNSFGSIKVKVLEVLESDEFGLMLIFACDDDMVFLPKAGEILEFKDPNGEVFDVYFPNLVFDWTDGVKKVMILLKSPTLDISEDERSTE